MKFHPKDLAFDRLNQHNLCIRVTVYVRLKPMFSGMNGTILPNVKERMRERESENRKTWKTGLEKEREREKSER